MKGDLLTYIEKKKMYLEVCLYVIKYSNEEYSSTALSTCPALLWLRNQQWTHILI